MLLELRADLVRRGLAQKGDALSEKAVAFVMGNPRLWGVATGLARIGQRPFLRDNQLHLPIDLIGERKPPHLQKKSFRQMWKDGEVEE